MLVTGTLWMMVGVACRAARGWVGFADIICEKFDSYVYVRIESQGC